MAATRQRGWWYPYIFVGGFLVVVAVNASMAYFATSTFSGISTDGAYQKGLAYNQNLAMARAQEALGWKVYTKVTPVTDAQAIKANIAVSYLDRNGKPVEGLEVRARLVRPTAKGYDHELTLAPLGNGQYGGMFPLPLNGVWDMDMVATGPDVAYEHAQRFVIP